MKQLTLRLQNLNFRFIHCSLILVILWLNAIQDSNFAVLGTGYATGYESSDWWTIDCEISLLPSHFGLMSDFGLGLDLFQPNSNWFVEILFSSRFIPLSVLVGFVIEHSVIEFCTLWFGISDERFFTSIVICYGFCTSHACFHVEMASTVAFIFVICFPRGCITA